MKFQYPPYYTAKVKLKHKNSWTCNFCFVSDYSFYITSVPFKKYNEFSAVLN